MAKRKFIHSIGFAVQGIRAAWDERNFKLHVCAAIVVIIASFVTGLSMTEWAIICLVIAIVLMAEMFNTAIEMVVDLASPNIHPLAKAAKDIAAGAVLVFAIFSVIIGILIFIPKWISLL